MKRGALLLAGLLLVLPLLAACSKRPVTASVPAPAPSSAGSRSSAVQPRAKVASTGPSGRRGSVATPDGSPRAGRVGPGTPGRIPPREFAPEPDLVDIHFDFDRYEVRTDAARILDVNAVWLKANPAHLVLIEGHCDERGTTAYNLALGELRASAARHYLVAHGVQASRITIVSYGKERPVCTESTEGCRAKNRRAHFLVKAR